MSYQHILAAIDFSEAAPQVLERAKTLCEQSKARLSLIHVVEYLPPLDLSGDPMTIPVTSMVDDALLKKNAQAALARFATQHQLGDCTQMVVVGVPKLEITRALEDQQIDLLVIGSHGRHGLARLLGSTARAVLNDAGCDVLAVRIKNNG